MLSLYKDMCLMIVRTKTKVYLVYNYISPILCTLFLMYIYNHSKIDKKKQ